MTINQLISGGALFIINHSAGKDSQAMTIQLRKTIPHHQLVVIHAELPEMDWPGNEEHKLSIAKRLWYEYLPIHDLTLERVWNIIHCASQEPHYAYKLGMSRLSCRFCIMSSREDLKTSAKHNPELLDKIDVREKKYDFTFMMPTKKGGPVTLKNIIKA